MPLAGAVIAIKDNIVMREGKTTCSSRMLANYRSPFDATVVERLAAAGIRYIGSDTTHVVCLPTCHHAVRITDRHRVPFRTMRAAADAGYRPCHVCRPDAGTAVAA